MLRPIYHRFWMDFGGILASKINEKSVPEKNRIWKNLVGTKKPDIQKKRTRKIVTFLFLDNSGWCTPYWNVWWVLSAQSLCKILYTTIVPQLLHIYWWTIFISCHNGIFCVWAIEHIFLIQCLKWWRHMLLLKISWKKPKNNSLFQFNLQSLSHRDSGHFSFELTLWEYYEFKTE